MKQIFRVTLIASTLLQTAGAATGTEEIVRGAISNFLASFIPLYLSQKRAYFAAGLRMTES